MANSNTVLKDYAELEVNLHYNKHDAAMTNLNNIINDLETKRTTNNSCTETLIVYLIKRINMNFNNQKYDGVVQDGTLLKDLGENLYQNKELFILYEHSVMQHSITEAEKRFKQAKIEFKYDDEIVSIANRIENIDVRHIYSRNTQTKPVAKKQKNC